MAVRTTVDDLLDLLASGAGTVDSADPQGNAVDQLAHALQTASHLDAAGADDELVAAGLVHDIGHLLPDGFHVGDHEVVGADLVRPVLGPRVAALVALHVPAKRYLATVEEYPLSSGSTASLAVQGGAMTDAERVAFEADALAGAAVALRRADDAAKVPGAPVDDLDRWRPVLHAVRRRHRR